MAMGRSRLSARSKTDFAYGTPGSLSQIVACIIAACELHPSLRPPHSLLTRFLRFCRSFSARPAIHRAVCCDSDEGMQAT